MLGAFASLLAAVVAITCADSGAIAKSKTPAVVAGTPSHARTPEIAPPAARDVKSSSALDAAGEQPARAAELGHFFAALEALARGERKESVRILWFGDSHTAADYWTGAVRARLSERYGSGGPGFVRVGVSPCRHDLAVLNRTGRFRVEPEPPARRSLQDDGVFGLGGIRVGPSAEPVRMTLKLPAHAPTARVHFTVLFDLPDPSATVFLNLGTESVTIQNANQAARVPNSPILRKELSGTSTDVLTLETRRGRPRFYGVLVETDAPGVVLDTLGIDGARIATTLAWAELPFVAEVAARNPELFVVAFGTNEAFDELDVTAYDRQLSELVARLRRGAPHADCLVLGPPDALLSSGEPAPRVARISAVYAEVSRRLGCAFASAQQLMGGPGSFATWLREDPPLARPDRIHFTPKGYRALGELVAVRALGLAPATPALPKNSP